MMEALGSLPQFFEAVKNAPPAPLFMRAFGRFCADLVIREAITAGPTNGWIAAAEVWGMNYEQARAFYDATMKDAIGRTLIEEPKALANAT